MTVVEITRVVDQRIKDRMMRWGFQWTVVGSLCAVTLWWYVFGLIQMERMDIIHTDGDDFPVRESMYLDINGQGQEPDDGHWAIGLYRGGSSPLHLQPIDISPWRTDDDTRRAWPLSNPVFTKLHVEEGENRGVDSSSKPLHGVFVSDPFLFQASATLASTLGMQKDVNILDDSADTTDMDHEKVDEDPRMGMIGSVVERNLLGQGMQGNEQIQQDESAIQSQIQYTPLNMLVKGPMYLFFRTQNLETRKADVGVAVSNNGGLVWTHLGIALSSQNYSFSYPYIFEWDKNVYMLPEVKGSGELALYKANLNNFPFAWGKVSTLLDVPVVNPSIIEWNGLWYLFVTDDMDRDRASFSSAAEKIELHIYHAETPLGPWMSHFLNPVMVGNEGSGARMAGRLVKQDDKLYRFGQDGQGSYGKDVLAFRIDVLTPQDFVQTRVKFQAGRIRKGTGTWNSQRRHHVDMMQLSDGSWLGVMDGDYFHNHGPGNKGMFLLGAKHYIASLIAAGIVVRMIVRSNVIIRRKLSHSYRKVSMATSCNIWTALSLSSTLYQRLRSICILVGFALSTIIVLFVAKSWICRIQYYNTILDPSNITHEMRIPVEGTYSKFTVIIDSVGSKTRMRAKSRKKVFSTMIKHYAACPSTSEVILSHSEDDASMVEYLEKNFSPFYRPWIRNTAQTHAVYDIGDFSISTRAASILSYGNIISCNDLEKVFALWRHNPNVLYGSNTFVQHHQEPSPVPKGHFSLLSSGLFFIDFERLVEIDRNKSFNITKSIAAKYDACDDIVLSMMWLTSGTASLGHFQPTRSMNLLPLDKSHMKATEYSKNECFEEIIEHDRSMYQSDIVYQLEDENEKVPFCIQRGLFW